MSHYSAKFQCFAGCEGSYPVTKALYRCPKCGGLLEVKHDMAALRDRSAAAWMRLFEERYMRTSWPYGSGVWGKREWVMPHLGCSAVARPSSARRSVTASLPSLSVRPAQIGTSNASLPSSAT